MMKMGWPSAAETVVGLFLLCGVYLPACWFAIKAVLRVCAPMRFAQNATLRYILLFAVVFLTLPYITTQAWSGYISVAEEWRGYKHYRYVRLLQNMPKYIAENTNFYNIQLCNDYILINSALLDAETQKKTIKILCDIAYNKVLQSKYSAHYVSFVIWDSPQCPKSVYNLEHVAPEALHIMCFNSGHPMVSGRETP